MDPDLPTEDGDIPVRIAAREGHCAAFVALLAAGANPGQSQARTGGTDQSRARVDDGLTPLELLLDSDAAQDVNRDTEALRAAVASFMCAGGDVNSSGKTQRLYRGDVAGDRPLHTALRLGIRCESIVFEIIGSGSTSGSSSDRGDGGGDGSGDGDGRNGDGGDGDIDEYNGEEEAAATEAVMAGAAAGAARREESAQAVAAAVGKDNETPLLIAVGGGGASVAVVVRLLQLAPTLVDARDGGGETALLHAVRRVCSACRASSSGGSPNGIGSSGDDDDHKDRKFVVTATATAAAAAAAWDVVTALLAANADPNVGAAATGETPLLAAVRALVGVTYTVPPSGHRSMLMGAVVALRAAGARASAVGWCSPR
jgi:hypothetical protein